jgi:hypothetical protein
MAPIEIDTQRYDFHDFKRGDIFLSWGKLFNLFGVPTLARTTQTATTFQLTETPLGGAWYLDIADCLHCRSSCVSRRERSNRKESTALSYTSPRVRKRWSINWISVRDS